MSNKFLGLGNWLNTHSITDVQEKDELVSELLHSLQVKKSTQTISDYKEEGFHPSQYVTPGWNGCSLLSKNGLELRKLFTVLKTDVLSSFLSFEHLPKSLRQPIYEDFISFAGETASNCKFDNAQNFWNEIHDEDSQHREILDIFLNSYATRVAMIYFLKIKFIESLSRVGGEVFADQRDYLNPSNFFQALFKTGTSRDLKVEALSLNHYSWYRPLDNLVSAIESIVELLPKIDVEEFLKIINSEIEESHIYEDQQFSHALSHKNFGEFITSILLSYGEWENRLNTKKPLAVQPVKYMKVLNCRFTGDHLSSLAHSHWLAQECNSHVNWKTVIAPEFANSASHNQKFLRICYELHYLAFLVELGSKNNLPVLDFIVETVRLINQNKKPVTQQPSFFDNDLTSGSSKFERILLNLTEFPKKNPHHFLVQRINSERQFLADSGKLIVFSNHKLFVPSQKDRVEQLLNYLTLETCFTLKDLKGKGEIASYIYIFSKTKQKNKLAKTNKKPCYSFRLKGSLETLHQLSGITYEIESFYVTHPYSAPPLYRKELDDLFSLEFFQDAIVDGRMINFTNKDANKVTHPVFFQNLMKSCVPLENFFNVKPIQHDKNELTNKSDSIKQHFDFTDLLGRRVTEEESFENVIIVDQRQKEETRLEIIPFDTYRAISFEYGHKYCHYFGVTSKFPELNLNLFREYFNSAVGKQLIDLSFTGATSKYKGKLTSLLVPRFFATLNQIPSHINSVLCVLDSNVDELLQMNARDFKSKFDHISDFMNKISVKYPTYLISKLTLFKNNLENFIELYTQSKSASKLCFETEHFQRELIKLPSAPLYPENDDVFIDFALSNQHDIHSTIERHEIVPAKKDVPGEGPHLLVSLKAPGSAVKLYANEYMLQFLSIILGHMKYQRLSDCLQSIYVPSAMDLESITKRFREDVKAYVSVCEQTDFLIKEIFAKNLSSLNS